MVKPSELLYVVFCVFLYQIVETLECVKHQSAHITVSSLLPMKSVNYYNTRSYNVQGSNQSGIIQAERTIPATSCPWSGCSVPCTLVYSVAHVSHAWSTAPSSQGRSPLWRSPIFFFRCTGPAALLSSLSWPVAGMLCAVFHGFSCARHVVSQVVTQAHNLILSYSWLSPCFSGRTMQETCCFRHGYFSCAMSP